MVDISDRRDQIIEYIGAYQKEHGYGPSVRDISTEQNMSLSSVHHHLRTLIREGVLDGETGKARTWRLRAS